MATAAQLAINKLHSEHVARAEKSGTVALEKTEFVAKVFGNGTTQVFNSSFHIDAFKRAAFLALQRGII